MGAINRDTDALGYELAQVTAQNYPALATFLVFSGEPGNSSTTDTRAVNNLLVATNYAAFKDAVHALDVNNAVPDGDGFSSLQAYYDALNSTDLNGNLTTQAQNLRALPVVMVDGRPFSANGFTDEADFLNLKEQATAVTTAQHAWLAREDGGMAAVAAMGLDITQDQLDAGIGAVNPADGVNTSAEVAPLARDLQALMVDGNDGVRFGIDTDDNRETPTEGLIFSAGDFEVGTEFVEVSGVKLDIQDIDNLLEGRSATNANGTVTLNSADLTDAQRATLQELMNVMKDNGVVTEQDGGTIQLGAVAPTVVAAALNNASQGLGGGGF